MHRSSTGQIPPPAGPSSPPITSAPPTPAKKYFNRESSWLNFNRRVLELAEDPQVPLLERARFLAIFSANLDEFFMKRVGGLQRQQHAGVTERSIDGLTAVQQLELIRTQLLPMLEEQVACWLDEVKPALEQQ